MDGFNPIVFCRFIDTAEYVVGHLASALGDGYAVTAVTGTLPPEERLDRVKKLTSHEDRRPMLVATDCLSEGVNLQQHFQAVVHYDLAWNPTRHEQREGRVDRFGQVAETVRAVTLYGVDNAIDGIALGVLLRKHEQIRKALGVSVPVPDRSDDVIQAILEGLLLARDPGEQLALDIGTTAHLPIGLRDGLTPGHHEPLPFRRALPVKPREAYLDRTDPNVAAIARYVLGSALDPTIPSELRPARRCGVMRTSVVQRRTTLVLARFRMHVTLPGRNEARQLVAEDAQVKSVQRGDSADESDLRVARWCAPLTG